MLKKIDPSKTECWEKLLRHYKYIRNIHMKELFKDKERFKKFSITYGDILFDFSKNIIDEKTLDLLLLLAEETGVEKGIISMFCGDLINETENRPVLHTALRDQSGKPIKVNGRDIMPGIRKVRNQMKTFSHSVRSGKLKGCSKKMITDVVNIGIGGSDLGPKMVCEALKYYSDGPEVHFVSNVDATDLSETLKDLDPETTLFLIASKTFTTQETMTNAYSARKWFLDGTGDEKNISKHFAAMSVNIEAATGFGIDEENIFEFWDFVGGRYSLWSSIGLSVAISLGYDKFMELLEGAADADEHFRHTDLRNNIPVIMALISIWYTDFFGCECEMVLPYDQYLHRFPAYLQQLSMESNGKRTARDGSEVTYRTGQVILGEPGTNGQHSFYQLLHQGTHMIPADFICAKEPLNAMGDHHLKLQSNFLAQTEALMKGKTPEEALETLYSSGLDKESVEKLYPHKIFPGNKPSNSIVLDKLTPGSLGRLIAFYEHKVFVQGIIWNIFSFDQWGVELGKELAAPILEELKGKFSGNDHDPSTRGLLDHLRSKK